MKLSTSIILASLAAGASAFAPQAHVKTNNFAALRMVEENNNMEASVAAVDDEATTPKEPVVSTPPLPAMSQALPFMARPAALDGSLVGDVGFDPLGFAKTKDDLLNYREAEIKHGRLAMLAAAGWPLSELFDAKIAKLIGAAPVVDASAKAPSVLNGGLGKISPVYWVACLAAAGAIDVIGIMKSKNDKDYTPGNFGFDPLGLYPSDKEGQEKMQLAELKNGRLAMVAITAFAFQEFVSGVGVVNETPFFFKPIGETMFEAMNSGYYMP